METPEFQEPHDLLDFKARGLITTHEWWMLRQLDLFRFCWQVGLFEIPQLPKHTKQTARCSLCGKMARPGLLKLWIHGNSIQGAFEARFHVECFERIQKREVAYA
jgi:hypothetical protein